MIQIVVECYSGYKADETPRKLILGKRIVEVKEIVDRWIGESHRYFKIRGNDDCIYLIRQDEDSDVWELVMFENTPFDLNSQEC